MRSHIGWEEEKNTLLKTLRETPKEKAQRKQYLLAVSLGRYSERRNKGVIIERNRGGANKVTYSSQVLVYLTLCIP